MQPAIHSFEIPLYAHFVIERSYRSEFGLNLSDTAQRAALAEARRKNSGQGLVLIPHYKTCLGAFLAYRLGAASFA